MSCIDTDIITASDYVKLEISVDPLFSSDPNFSMATSIE
jgi:hypothetical protein